LQVTSALPSSDHRRELAAAEQGERVEARPRERGGELHRAAVGPAARPKRAEDRPGDRLPVERVGGERPQERAATEQGARRLDLGGGLAAGRAWTRMPAASRCPVGEIRASQTSARDLLAVGEVSLHVLVDRRWRWRSGR
jgi:hypothetical protein